MRRVSEGEIQSVPDPGSPSDAGSVVSTAAQPVELRQQGFTALVAALGWVNAVRFIQQYEVGRGDYTQERYEFLPAWDAETLVRKAKERVRR